MIFILLIKGKVGLDEERISIVLFFGSCSRVVGVFGVGLRGVCLKISLSVGVLVFRIRLYLRENE